MKRNLILAAGLIVLACVAVPGRLASAATEVPPKLRMAVQVTGVYCSGPCCCGSVRVTYRGFWYDRPLGYCRWWRPLREGETVVTTLYLSR